ncbi:hypothetical protein [Limnohabitans sp. T6-20]|uniref:hypothetical protein n=1 Tax=Limnohabitans sp. T6-20 TaxID=1100725 RepID=UPI0011B24D1D|nr:hypothetical protein [Limnohabitans sp. T6-20]
MVEMKHAFKWALAGVVLCWLSPLWADVLLDFSVVLPPAVDKHKVVQPVVQWLVRADAPGYCQQIKEHDGFAVWQEGCVYWTSTPSTCSIVTTGRTTHSQVGRLFLLCLTAGEPT